MYKLQHNNCKESFAFQIRGWGTEKPLLFKLEPDFDLNKYQYLINDQIKSIDLSISNLNIVDKKVASIIPSEKLKIKSLKNSETPSDLNLKNIIHKESNGSQGLYFSNPYVPGEFKENNKYLIFLKNKLDLFKRTILHVIKIVCLKIFLTSSKILLIPFLKRHLAPCFGLKNNITKELEKEFHEADIIYTDSVCWLLRHILYIKCDIIFCRKLNLKFDPLNYRNIPFTIRNALKKNADSPDEINRLIIHDQLSDDGYSLKALNGLLNQKDSIVIHCDNLPTEVLNWDYVTEVEQEYYLCRGMPVEWKKTYIPSEPIDGWPKISIVTVSYNQAEFIEDCLNSILNQGYPNLEYIVIDGQSTDGTVEILNKFKDRINHLIIEPDDGQSNALNKGFNIASGEIMTWICSDDMLVDGALFHIGQVYAQRKVDLIVGGCKIISEKGDLIHHHHTAIPLNKSVNLSFSDMLNFMGSWHKGQYFYQPEIFFSKNIWQLSGGYLKEHLYYAMDYDMFLRMGMAGANILHIPQVIGVSRQHSKQKTQYLTKDYLPQIKMIMEEYLEMINATIITAN